MKPVEFYPEKQGRPDSKVSLDMERRGPTIPLGYITLALLSEALKDILVSREDVDDKPVNGAVDIPISSNWAYDYTQEQEEQYYLQDLRLKAIFAALVEGLDWDDVEWDDLDYEDIIQLVKDSVLLITSIPTVAVTRKILVNKFTLPDPISEWKDSDYGAYLDPLQIARVCRLPLNFLQVGDIITAYSLVGDATKTTALTLDCKLVQVNKTSPLTTTDVANGSMVQITAGGNFDKTVTPKATKISTDKQYYLKLTGTTGVADEIYVIGAEVTIMRLI